MSGLQAISPLDNQLVFVERNVIVTDSLTIAKMFDKRHDNVIADIRTQIDYAGEEFSLLNFQESKYRTRGKEYLKYNLTEEAFTLVVMSYNTKEAVQMKIKFIQEFKRMKEHIQKQMSPLKMINTITSEMMKQDERLETIENKLNEKMTIDSYQQTTLLNAKLRRVEKLWGEEPKIRQAFEDKRILHSRAWKDFKMAFVVPSYRDTKEKDFEEALTYLKAWRPGLI
ncbi:Rha family transcriptional regulator [Bacillus cereus]|uniref:Rha family transcriptional regulator n=1 Tax=Bacillus thuringiensis TaxID=1428 RepID=A0A9W3VGW5_BACTU|nr:MULTISPECIES: Rha family transcriptional regulator [Bacillus cereus group]AMR06469.1 Rha family transcriptional regulator [Bacillus thuringiensis]AYF84998.1 Rha family transcriptional regulator [Bacillus thuringiensis]MDF9503700.1 Rha family transcriptional regulator [Bacillus cereus]MDF9597440.1 Rha family transcriptional regulator [Bacillus cereus]MDF9609521.1 Rha family transcriptional regulator [Bacillus cereus]